MFHLVINKFKLDSPFDSEIYGELSPLRVINDTEESYIDFLRTPDIKFTNSEVFIINQYLENFDNSNIMPNLRNKIQYYGKYMDAKIFIDFPNDTEIYAWVMRNDARWFLNKLLSKHLNNEDHDEVINKLALVQNANEAIKNDHLELLKMLSEEHGAIFDMNASARCAAVYGHLDIIEWCINNCKNQVNSNRIDNWTIHNNARINHNRIIAAAVEHKQQHIVAYEQQFITDSQRYSYALSVAAINNNLDAYILLQQPQSIKYALNDAIKSESFAIIEYIYDSVINQQDEPDDTTVYTASRMKDDIIYSAIICDSTRVIDWCKGKGIYKYTRERMNLAISRDSINIIMIFENDGETFHNDILARAAGAGALNVVKYVHAKRLCGCDDEILDIAALNGHVDILDFLYANYPACYTKGMTCTHAITHYPKIVEWFKTHPVKNANDDDDEDDDDDMN